MPTEAKGIGLDVPWPEQTCSDPKCPFHGHLKVRGQLLEGTVVSDKMEGTVRVRRDYQRLIPKFDRLEKRRSTYSAHLPPCLGVEVGDAVLLGECRPLAKTVAFVVVAKRGGAA